MARKAKITDLNSIDLQKIRLSALDLQLRSLRFQARAIDSIATEHTAGLNLRSTRYFDHLDKTVGRFVARVKEFLKVADTMPADEACSWLSEMAAWKTTIIGDTEEKENFQGSIAAARVKADIAGRPVTVPDDIPSDFTGQEVKAYCFCLTAEKAQLKTFSLQVAATCNLGMEIILTAAAEANKKREACEKH
jgi:hypothetical protein